MTSWPAFQRSPVLQGGLLALAYLLFACCELGHYGPTWDISIGEIPHGERYLDYLQTGDEVWLDFASRIDDSPPPAPHPIHDPVTATTAMTWAETCPLGGILSAIACRVLFESLGIATPMVAHLVVAPAFAAALMFLMFVLMSRRFGTSAAIGSVLACFLSPRFFDDSFHNIKDIPEAALYSFAAVAYCVALTHRGKRHWIVAGICHGLALAQKPNALFLFPQIGLVLLVLLVLRRAPAWRSFFGGCAIALVFLLASFWIASPMYWAHPIQSGIYRLAFLLAAGTREGVWEPFETIRVVAVTTPPALLALALVGALRRDVPVVLRSMILLGVAVPLGRTMLPGMVNFDGVRHFWEFWPPTALLAGLGFDKLVRAVAAWRGRLPTASTLAASATVAFGFPAFAVVDTFPHGICYFNSFIGGLKGAQDRGEPQATDYWAGSYWQGLEWFAANTTSSSKLCVPLHEHVARFAAPLREIPESRFADPYAPPEMDRLYVMFTTLSEVYDDTLRWLVAERTPHHQIQVQGAPILVIFRLDDREDIERVFRGWSESRAIQRSLRWLDHSRIRLLRASDDESMPRLLEQFPEHVRRDVEIAARVFRRLPN